MAILFAALLMQVAGFMLLPAPPARAQIERYQSVSQAYRLGVESLVKGDTQGALPALRYAADNGHIQATAILARLYAKGDGVSKNDEIAYKFYRQIANDHANIPLQHPAARFVADAFVQLGLYQRTGIPAIGLEPDDRKAAVFFLHAASYFGAPDAQYHLGRMLLTGAGVRKNIVTARRWLVSAAKKGHAPAQAFLGQMLWDGRVFKRNPVKALALLTLARVNARSADADWIDVIYQSISQQAEPKHLTMARTVVARWRRIYGLTTINKSNDAADMMRPVTGAKKPPASARTSPFQEHRKRLPEIKAGDEDQIIASPQANRSPRFGNMTGLDGFRKIGTTGRH